MAEAYEGGFPKDVGQTQEALVNVGVLMCDAEHPVPEGHTILGATHLLLPAGEEAPSFDQFEGVPVMEEGGYESWVGVNHNWNCISIFAWQKWHMGGGRELVAYRAAWDSLDSTIFIRVAGFLSMFN